MATHTAFTLDDDVSVVTSYHARLLGSRLVAREAKLWRELHREKFRVFGSMWVVAT